MDDLRHVLSVILRFLSNFDESMKQQKKIKIINGQVQRSVEYLRSTEVSTRGVLQKKGVLRNFTKFTGKHLCQSLFFNKVAGLSPAALLRKRLWHRCFPVNFAKFRRTPFLQSTSGRLLLDPATLEHK